MDADLRQMRLESELDHAQAEADRARGEVEKISRDHLETAMQRSRAERAKRVDDPELTPADRQTLVASLAGNEAAAAAGGWRPTLNESRKDALLRLWGQNRHHAPAMIRTIVLLGPVCAFAAMSYSNTGYRVVAVSGNELEFVNPDGSHYSTDIRRDETFVVVRHFGRYYTRMWKERQGYALAPINMK